MSLRGTVSQEGVESAQLYDALGVLVIHFPSGCRMTELARALRVVPSTATRAVDALVANGLAERTRAESDARATIVEATSEGIDLYLATSQVTSPILRARLDVALSRAEQGVLATLLERVIAVFDEASGADDLDDALTDAHGVIPRPRGRGAR